MKIKVSKVGIDEGFGMDWHGHRDVVGTYVSTERTNVC